MHAHVKPLLTTQETPKVTTKRLFRRAGRTEWARKVTGEFLPADTAHHAFPMDAKDSRRSC